MKPSLIRTESAFPPGGFQFLDPITGKHYRDTYTLFSQRVKEVIRDRSANTRLVANRQRLEPAVVAQEISEQNCERLKNDPNWCTHGSMPSRTVAPTYAVQPAAGTPSDRPCIYCGKSTVTEARCTSCGAGVVTYSCPDCGRKWK